MKIESPALVFDIDSNDQEKIVIDFEKLKEVFKEMLNVTLLGIREFL